ncbi:MAG: hypothetical protein J0G32_00690 [Alphaproteobacteria bacterium]|mgnify:CR=1 FL=1|nr:hypothetical protein [Alphaproteobacteria bacterium]OJV14090.1 MAG: hypothetical protein BGO27_01215 [Alphaproteobacteria bacterium 33-17]
MGKYIVDTSFEFSISTGSMLKGYETIIDSTNKKLSIYTVREDFAKTHNYQGVLIDEYKILKDTYCKVQDSFSEYDNYLDVYIYNQFDKGFDVSHLAYLDDDNYLTACNFNERIVNDVYYVTIHGEYVF